MEAVLKLPDEERAELAAQVMESVETWPGDEEFAIEIERRIAEVESGAVETIPWEETRKRSRERL